MATATKTKPAVFTEEEMKKLRSLRTQYVNDPYMSCCESNHVYMWLKFIKYLHRLE